MWLPVETTVAPADDPVTLEDARAWLRVDATDEDDTISAMVKSAVAMVEKYTGLRLYTQTIKLRCSAFVDLTDIPVGPIQSVLSIEYIDGSGVTQTLSDSVYETFFYGLAPSIGLAYGQSWPNVRESTAAVVITAVAGFGDDGDLPSEVRTAILMLVSGWFNGREGSDGLPSHVMALLENYRVH